MKARGEDSPGKAEALACTFYAPVKSSLAMEHYYRATGQMDTVRNFKKQQTKHKYDVWDY